MDAGEIKKAFAGDRGKVLVLVGVAGVGYLWWTRSRTPSTPQPVAADGLHTGGSAPSGSTGSSTDPTPAPDPNGRPTSNAQWLDKAVKILSNPPWNYSETAVWNAINKAFLGSPISTSEENWIRAAMSALGTPPEGMPPLNIMAPTPPAQGTPTPPASGTKTVHVAEGSWLSRIMPASWTSNYQPFFNLNPSAKIGKSNKYGYISPTNPESADPGSLTWVFTQAQDIQLPA